MIENYIAFIGSSLILILAPGPDIIFAITQGVVGGRKAGVLTALGLSVGNLFHTLVCMLGIGLVITTNPVLFSTIQILGSLYLFFLAYKSFVNRNQKFKLENEKVSKHLFYKGLIMNILNPKVVIFFLAFFPQFIKINSFNLSLQILILGIIFSLLVFIIFGSFAYFSGFISLLFKEKPKLVTYLNISSSIIFIALGCKILILSYNT